MLVISNWQYLVCDEYIGVFMSKKLFFCFSSVVMLILASGFSCASIKSNRQGEKWGIKTTSPNGLYAVTLDGVSMPPSRNYYPYGKHYVRFSVVQGSKTIAVNEPLFGGDEYDDLFWHEYRFYKWQSENVLRFMWENKELESQSDSIIITNNTDLTIDYLRLHIDDIFLILNISPKEKLELKITNQPYPASPIIFIWCYAKMGEKVFQNNNSFNNKLKTDKGFGYYIDFNKSGIEIRSPDLVVVQK